MPHVSIYRQHVPAFFSFEIAQQFITSHTHDTVLVIGAEKLTWIADWTDRNTCVLFGDGAGAAIFVPGRRSWRGQHPYRQQRAAHRHFYMPAADSRFRITRENVRSCIW